MLAMIVRPYLKMLLVMLKWGCFSIKINAQ